MNEVLKRVLPSKIYDFFFVGHERTLNAKYNIFLSFIIKGLSILISLLLVPLTINYINPTRYGIWLTLSSIVGWFSFFDIGFGNGLRNKFAEAKAKGEIELARTYVSTTYAILGIIIFIVLLIFQLINPYLSWAKILNAPLNMDQELKTLALITFTFFCLQFVFQLITTVLTADQKPAKAALFNLFGSIASLIIIYILTKTTNGSLIYLGFVLSFIPLIVLILSTIWFYNHEYKKFSPSLKFVKISYAKDLLNLGVKFFIIQISALVLYQTNNLIISHLYSAKDVTVYNIAQKYFNIIPMVFSIIIAPFWSAFTEAYYKNDYSWIKKVVKNLVKIWLFTSALSILMLIIANYIYEFWVGKSITIPFKISVACAFYVIIVTWSNIFLSLINGIGKVLFQLLLTIIVIFINIPLAIFLSKNMEFGVSGVIWANCICFLLFAISIPFQYNLIINNKAKGLWNR